MRGKIGFVLGAALGYVLGTRAGRARYEQIKSGAAAVWDTPLVQQGVTAVKHQVGGTVDNVKAAAAEALKGAFVAATQPRGSAHSQAAQSGASGSRTPASSARSTSDTRSTSDSGHSIDGAEETLV